MRESIRTLLLLMFLLACVPAHADWAADWKTCEQDDETLALQACTRMVANGDKSYFAYMRLGHLYEKRHEMIRARGAYLSAFQANPTNEEARIDYLRLVNDPYLAIEEMDKKGWLK